MQSAIEVTQEELNQALLESAFAKIYGFRLEGLARGECTLLVPYRKDFERPGGFVAGPVFMAAADVATWLAIMTLVGRGSLTLTYELKTTFLNPAKQEDILCTARILKCGRTLIYGIAEGRDRREQLLAHHTITYVRKSDSPSAHP
jgi:uncharacterized protein (TIGR00369 family)